jgi:hypothetical protein
MLIAGKVALTQRSEQPTRRAPCRLYTCFTVRRRMIASASSATPRAITPQAIKD